MNRILALMFLTLAGCGDNTEPDPQLDAGSLPTCASIGCPTAFCNAAGVCSCLVDGAPTACQVSP